MEVQLDKRKKWFYRIVRVQNGQTLLTSQTYFNKFSARRAAKRFAAINKLSYREVHHG